MTFLITWTATVAVSLGFWTTMIVALARLLR